MKNQCPSCKEEFGLMPLPSKKYGPDEEWPAGRGVLPICPKCGTALLANTHKYEQRFMYLFFCLVVATLVAMWFLKALWVVWVSIFVFVLFFSSWFWVKHTLLAKWERWVAVNSKSSNKANQL